MIRKNVGGSSLLSNATSNQENNMFRHKTHDAVGGTLGTRPATKPLGDIKNQGALPKRTLSLKAGKADENAPVTKVEPRRPLRSTSSLSSNPLVVAKPIQAKQPFIVGKSTTSFSSFATNSSTNNSTLSSTTNVNIKFKKELTLVTAKIDAGVVVGKTRLQRQNALSNLQITNATSTSNASVGAAECSTARLDTADLDKLQAALCLAPVKEENEERTAESDNAYSSSMMPNIDKDDRENPQLVSEYVNDIYDYLRILEQKQCIKENFLEGKEVTGRMRSILIDWLSQVHIRFHLLPETLYMTVALIDRFLQEVAVPKEKLQLVGVTAMFVASKYEEMYAPEIGDFVYITDHSCSKPDIRAMECLLLRTLGFKLGRPLPIHFLRRYSKAADSDPQRHTLAKYFLELALVQYPLSHFAPSIMAASAIWLASKLLDPTFEWSPTLIFYTKYRESDFTTCLRRLCRIVVKTHTNEIKQQAIRNKFSTSKFMDISKHPCLDMARIRQYGEF